MIILIFVVVVVIVVRILIENTRCRMQTARAKWSCLTGNLPATKRRSTETCPRGHSPSADRTYSESVSQSEEEGLIERLAE